MSAVRVFPARPGGSLDCPFLRMGQGPAVARSAQCSSVRHGPQPEQRCRAGGREQLTSHRLRRALGGGGQGQRSAARVAPYELPVPRFHALAGVSGRQRYARLSRRGCPRPLSGVAWEGGRGFSLPSLCASENQTQGVME